ncbi:uncharacterized protein P884DRAFT_111504 [Thermothelomyces heterothallicus CBS 202.75]|uniref:uncharacterized protein n=1 Tax=Thermothelomyces heterothallicus CBS 202.75 TaxID=1149848 RepID=UPI003742411F
MSDPSLSTMAPRRKRSKAITLAPTIFWSFREKTFRYGPARISYDRAISRLTQGFKLILDGEICTFNGQSWSLGNQDISISDFREILLNLNPKKADLLQALPGVEIPDIPTYSLKEALSYAESPRTHTHTKNLFSWKFETTPSLEIEPCRVLILALQATGAGAHLAWVSEEVLHRDCRDLLLQFWERGGGRDTALARNSGYREGNIFSAHCIIKHRGGWKRRQYLVEWVGYRERLWIKDRDVSCSLLEDYWKRVKTQRRRRKQARQGRYK